MKIYLGDLVHTWEKVSVWTMPLNVGFVGAYAAAQVPEIEEVRLFKRPDAMIEAIRRERPDVVGLANYVWNTSLNALVAHIAKSEHPATLIVGGGPQFTSLNGDEHGAIAFFSRYSAFDAYVLNQGERGFVALLQAHLAAGCDPERLKRSPVAGCLINSDARDGVVSVGERLDGIRDLDEIPSPYLNGMLDEFFDEPFNPMIETNRSCPYRCTFCAWGIGTTKLSKFSTERILDEIDYIARRCSNAVNLHICDANFGILERDTQIAEKLYDCHLSFGFPGVVNVQWNKTRPDRVLDVARRLHGIAQIGASMQSLNGETLDAIKRKNLGIEQVRSMLGELDREENDAHPFSELIVGLPGETWQSHIDANKRLMDLGFEVHNYNLHLLPGTEMDSAESRAANVRETRWRLHDNAYGVYEGVSVFEAQEVVRETPWMSWDELASFRYIHWLIQLMWGRRYYFDFLQLFRKAGLHPVDVVVEIWRAMGKEDGPIGDLYEEFTEDYGLEQFESYQALCDYWGRKHALERLKSGQYGKLNAVYSHKVLLEYYEAFNDFLFRIAEDLVDQLDIADGPDFLRQCREILRFGGELRIGLNDDLQLIETKRASFGFDILSWRSTGYGEDRPRRANGADFEYVFYIPEPRKKLLEAKLSRFRSKNANMTWRKMTEYSDAEQFFYEARLT